VHYHKFQRSGDGNDLSIIHGTIDGLLAYPFLGKWRVFIAGGMGLYAWQADHCWWTDGHNEEAGDIGFNYGIGVDYALTDDIEIESAIFQHRVEMKDNNRAFRWIEFAIGVRFNLFEHNN
jgi:opacity protein-like surface antigen